MATEPFATAATIHDYTLRCWGHDITYSPEDGGKVLRGSLWSPTAVREGDYLILANGDRTTRYRVTDAEWCVDPDDMYHFTAEFAPREAQAADLQSRVLDLCDSLGIVVGSALKAVSDA